MNRSLIDQYEADATLPSLAIEGLTREEMNSFPVEGTWSVQQVILHLMDSDLIASDRMKRVIAEPTPSIMAYDESAFSTHLGYDRLDPALACEIFRLNRLMTAAVLRHVPDDAFERVGIHSERGAESLAVILLGYVDHLHHHLKFIREKRTRLGKPLA